MAVLVRFDKCRSAKSRSVQKFEDGSVRYAVDKARALAEFCSDVGVIVGAEFKDQVDILRERDEILQIGIADRTVDIIL